MSQLSPEMVHLRRLQPVVQITMPRAGSEYLQSLFDGHPEVLVFNTNFRFFTDYVNTSKVLLQEAYEIDEVVYEFIGKEMHRLKTKYFQAEGMHRLGVNSADSLSISLEKYTKYFNHLMDGSEVSLANILLALYGAYHMALGRDVFALKVLWHHAHYLKEAQAFRAYFPATKLICNIRDPRASFYSISASYKKSGRKWYGYQLVWALYRSLNEFCFGIYLERWQDDFAATLLVRLEDLPHPDAIREISEFIGVKEDSSSYWSTWGGLMWRGDSVSARAYSAGEVWSHSRSDNGWRKGLSHREIALINFLFLRFLGEYGYIFSTEKISKSGFYHLILVLISLILPTRIEIDFFSPRYLREHLSDRRSFAKLLRSGFGLYEYLSVRAFLFKILINRNRTLADAHSPAGTHIKD